MTEQTVTVAVPFAVLKRGGRETRHYAGRRDSGHRRRGRTSIALFLRPSLADSDGRRCCRTGDYSTIEEVADAENINPSYVSRVLRMTLLAPEIVEAIVAGRQSSGLTMLTAMKVFPASWALQRRSWPP